MMLQVSNRCRMMCPHCMDDSRPDGGLMDMHTLRNALAFASAAKLRHVVISGGEPTEHPDLLNFCKEVSKAGLAFSLCSNGMWLGDEKAEWRAERIAKLRGFVGMQIYSNPKWYRIHNDTVARYRVQEQRWRGLGIGLDLNDIRSMSDIGRARTCEAAMEEVRRSKYHNMCLTAHLTAVQSGSLEQFFRLMLSQFKSCTPMVDWKGLFHMSESCLCPHIADINSDSPETIWERMRSSRPCGGCLPCRRFLSEDTDKMVRAREALGMSQVQDKEISTKER